MRAFLTYLTTTLTLTLFPTIIAIPSPSPDLPAQILSLSIHPDGYVSLLQGDLIVSFDGEGSMLDSLVLSPIDHSYLTTTIDTITTQRLKRDQDIEAAAVKRDPKEALRAQLDERAAQFNCGSVGCANNANCTRVGHGCGPCVQTKLGKSCAGTIQLSPSPL